MSNINKGEPAFPVHSVSWKEKDGTECVAIGTCGMTLRDYFAGQTLAADYMGDYDYAERAKAAYKAADAMLAEREATP
jgi:hypothetical protein